MAAKRLKPNNPFCSPCPDAIVADAQEFYNILWKINPYAKHNPVPKPITVRKANLPSLTSDYVVSEKNDGERFCLMVAQTAEEEMYSVSIDGKRHIATCPMLIENPVLTVKDRRMNLYNGTLLDGEWISNGDEGEFVVFDCVVAGGFNARKRPFHDRLELAKLIVAAIQPVGWSIRVKTFYPSSYIMELWGKIQKGEMGRCDGLIFVSKILEITTGTTEGTKKWKPNSHQTVDLRYQGGVFCCVGEDGRYIASPITVKQEGPFHPFIEDRMYEVRPEGNEWVVLKERPDKQYANHIKTILRTLDTIADNVTIEDIQNSVEYK